jgi:hypothetical protein
MQRDKLFKSILIMHFMTKGVKIFVSIFILFLFANYFLIQEVSAKENPPSMEDTIKEGFIKSLENVPVLGHLIKFSRKIQKSGAQEWQDKYTESLGKKVEELEKKNDELQKEINELQSEIGQIRHKPENQQKSLEWFNREVKSKEKQIEVSKNELQKNTKTIETLRKRIDFLEKIGSAFSNAWGFIRLFLIPLILVYLIRDILLTFIARFFDKITKIPIAGAIKNLVAFKGLLSSVIWFIAMLILYVSFLGGTFVESWIGRMLLFLTVFIMDLFSVSAENSTTIYSVIGIAALIITFGVVLLYLLLAKGMEKSVEIKRESAAKKMGRDIKALKETAAATAEGIS